MVNERRKSRSEVPNEAASLFLESMAVRNHLRALVLAGGDGLLMAGTRGGFDCDGLAALGVAHGNRMSVRRELADSILGGERMHTSSLDIGGQTFYLTSVGVRGLSPEEAGPALRRILGPTLTPVASA